MTNTEVCKQRGWGEGSVTKVFAVQVQGTDSLNQCKKSCAQQCTPVTPALREVETGRFLKLIGRPEKPNV